MRKSRNFLVVVIVLFSHLVFNGPVAHANTFNCTGGTYTVTAGVLQGNSTCTGAVVLDSSVTTINYATFFEGSGGQSITSISIPASVTYIYPDLPLGFRNSNLTEYIVDSSNPNYSSVDGVLYNKNQTRLIAYPRGKTGSTFLIPDSVTTVSHFAFQCSRYLQTISVGANLTTLSDVFFDYTGACWSGSLVREISVSASNSNYSSVDGVLFNKDVTRLIKYPYAKPGTSYTVPNTVTRIGGFGNNTTLTSITLPQGLRTIDTYAFEGSIITSISIPDSVDSYGSFPFYQNRALETFTVGAANSILKSVDGVLYSKNGTTLLEYPGGRKNESFSIPPGVTTVASQWTYANYLKRLTIPTTVTTIGSGGFVNWSRGSYLIFEGDSSLTSISGSYAKNIIYCGSANSAITAHAASSSGTVQCPTETQPPDFTLSSNVISGIRNTALVGYSITTTVAPYAYYITPSISYGLSFNASTGLITGTPTSTSASRTYTVTGHNWLGSVSRQVTLDIQASAPVTTAPGAPTIGSAVTLSPTSASVTFSAPASNGGASIETYTATSTPGSIVGRIMQAGSGTVTITGLSSSTTYTFRVTASNRIGTSSSSSATLSITTPASDAELAAQASAAASALAVQTAATLAAEAAKREAEKRTARSEIENKFKHSENVNLQTFIMAEIAGVSEKNFTAIQAEIQSLSQELRGDITQVIKVARKFEVVDLLASEAVSKVSSNVLVEVGLIPVESKNKSTLTNVVRMLPQESRNSYGAVKEAINSAIAEIQKKKDRLADVISRISSRSKG